jgi:phosphoglucosamine mutase
MMSRKYFGTDGIRGRVGEAPITPDFMLKLGWAAGRVLAKHSTGQKLILIGKATRISGYMFESALESGLINAGIDVGLLGPMPTPAIAYLTRTFRAQAGIVISASHNPYYDNGIKFFNSEGTKLADDIEFEIEAELDQDMVSADQLGKAKRIGDAGGRYIEFCKATMPRGFNFNGMKLVIDCANGATYHVAPNVFRELGAKVETIGTSPDGHNINQNCGSTSIGELQSKVLASGADMGIAFDGDGDRLAFVDRHGEIVDGDELLYILALSKHKYQGGCDGVVGTLMSNFGLELAFKELKIPFVRAKVGDRYVIETMKQNNWSLGGESSGHIVCSDVTTTGDGIVSSLQVTNALLTLGLSLADAKKGMSKLPQKMINVRVKTGFNFTDNQQIKVAVADVESTLNGRGRVLLRPSGTEPVIRVMVEGEDSSMVEKLAEKLASVVKNAVSVN